MSVLKDIQPQEVFRFFEAICDLPHGSKNTKILSDYCVLFAKIRELEVKQDKVGNVIIYKNASAGYVNHPTVILQGHLDMVCEKLAEKEIDFQKDGLTIKVEDGYVKADGTTLGGDDGIAVAMCLAILDNKNLPHPALEVVLTVDEEIGLLGASALDTNQLKGRRMINIDSEEEGILTCGCAGGIRSTLSLPIKRENFVGVPYTLSLTGFEGGHSGTEINKGHLNAILELFKLYEGISECQPMRLMSFSAQGKDNAIAREASLSFVIKEELEDATLNKIMEIMGKIQETEPAANISISSKKRGQVPAFSEETEKRARTLFQTIPNGILKMSENVPGLVQTSLNLGTLSCEKSLSLTFALRSSVNQERLDLAKQLKGIIQKLGGQYSEGGGYPAWEYREKSPLREIMVQTFKEQYGRECQVNIIHAGLECGIFSSRMKGLDCVSMGPDMLNIHTPKEMLSISSVERTWNYLLSVLKGL